MSVTFILAVLVVTVVVVPIRVIRLVIRRSYWADRWRVATRWRKTFAVAGWGLIAIAACAWLVPWVLILVKVADHRFPGGLAQAALHLLFDLAILGANMLTALVIGELLLLPLRRATRKMTYYQVAATRAGSKTPAGPRST